MTCPSRDDCMIWFFTFTILSARVCSAADGVLDTSTMSEKIAKAASQLTTTIGHLFIPDALFRLRWGGVVEYELLFMRDPSQRDCLTFAAPLLTAQSQ
mmetsp:Transcript_6420/g.9420  ORF Transcript_6420/g.9420 Transcript_6420/m.9420 type:complete len:98 (-) Transcript_6420:42-335(-)